MTIKLGIVMDPVETLTLYKDSTMAMIQEANDRKWICEFMTTQDLFVNNGVASATTTPIVPLAPPKWYETGDSQTRALSEFDVILMRKDPPFDMNYIYATQILELAEQQGTHVYNKPQSLRDFNEKQFITYFPQCCVPTLITSNRTRLTTFLHEHEGIILKPLDGMGGSGIFKISQGDPNLTVILEHLTQAGSTPIMAQSFIPDVIKGDKRILLINGEPIPYALARIPKPGEIRANLAAGGHGVSQPLSERDLWICEQVGPKLKEKGLVFVGIDVIGDYLTEINVTSPTCIKELDESNQINISGTLMDCIASKL